MLLFNKQHVFYLESLLGNTMEEKCDLNKRKVARNAFLGKSF